MDGITRTNDLHWGKEKAKAIFRKNMQQKGSCLIGNRTNEGKSIAGKLASGINIRIQFRKDGSTRLQISKKKYIFEK